MTRHETVTDEIRGAASLYSLGLLDPGEAEQFEAHLNACPVCKAELRACHEVLADVALATPTVRPQARVKEELLRRTLTPTVLMRAGEGEWQATPFPGVDVKQLFVDPVSKNVTSLVRLRPGAVYPPHRHVTFEHCYVIEGDVKIERSHVVCRRLRGEWSELGAYLDYVDQRLPSANHQ